MKLFFQFTLITLFLFSETVHASGKKMIVLSIDGYPGYYADQSDKFHALTPNLNELRKKSKHANTVRSVFPTMTYPSHTSMITGVDPAIHGIHFNSPVDPYGTNQGGWMWYFEDIKTYTLFDFAYLQKKKTASVYWPVTAGARIHYNIPQYWRSKNDEDKKLLSLLSTENLYKELRDKVGITVSETDGDENRVKAGIYLWKVKKPDILFIYTTDLDTAHHSYGIHSKEAAIALQKIDSLLGLLISETGIYNNNSIGLLVTSDHGFKKVDGICHPNFFLKKRNLIRDKSWSYFFKSMGGISILLKNEVEKEKTADLSELKNRIETYCPGTEFHSKGQLYDIVKRRFYKDAIAAIISRKNTAFNEKWDGSYYSKLDKPIYNHGFLPGDKDMRTNMIFYPGWKGQDFKTIKDSFQIVCKWTGIKCYPGEWKKN